MAEALADMIDDPNHPQRHTADAKARENMEHVPRQRGRMGDHSR
jgi:hypothetical protein